MDLIACNKLPTISVIAILFSMIHFATVVSKDLINFLNFMKFYCRLFKLFVHALHTFCIVCAYILYYIVYSFFTFGCVYLKKPKWAKCCTIEYLFDENCDKH